MHVSTEMRGRKKEAALWNSRRGQIKRLSQLSVVGCCLASGINLGGEGVSKLPHQLDSTLRSKLEAVVRYSG